MAGLRQTVLQIVNRTERKLGVPESSALTSSAYTQTLLDMLNEVIAECSDEGGWQEAFTTASVTAVSGQSSYEIPTTDIVQSIEEVSLSGQITPLYLVSGEEIRRLNRLGGTGTPRQFAIQGVNASGNPIIETFRRAGSQDAGKLFHVVYYKKPKLLTTSDGSTIPFFPAEVLFRGLYAKALLEENGGEPTREYQVSYSEYIKQRQEALNRYTADTGTKICFSPNGRGA